MPLYNPTSSSTHTHVESDVTSLTSDLTAKLVKASNLSDLASASTSRTNLGLAGAAVLAVGTTAGTVAAGDDPRIAGDLLTTGQEVMHRRFVTSNSVALSTSGNLRGTYFTARKSETVTQVRMWSGGTAAAATPTLVRAGLWTVDASGNGTALVASIVSDTALFASTNTAYTRSFSSSYAIVAGTRYAFGILVVSGAAIPTLIGATNSMGSEMFVAPMLGFSVASQSDLTNTFTATAGANQPYAVILP